MTTNGKAVNCKVCGTRIPKGTGKALVQSSGFLCPNCVIPESSSEDLDHEGDLTLGDFGKELSEPSYPESGPSQDEVNEMVAKIFETPEPPQGESTEAFLDKIDAELKEEHDWSFDSSIPVQQWAEVRYKVLTSSRIGYQTAKFASRDVAIAQFHVHFGGRADAKLFYSKKLEVSKTEAPLWEFHWTVKGG